MLHIVSTFANAELTIDIGWPNLSLSTAARAVLDEEVLLSMTCPWCLQRRTTEQHCVLPDLPEAKVAQLQEAPSTDRPPHTPTLYHKSQLEFVLPVKWQTVLCCPLA